MWLVVVAQSDMSYKDRLENGWTMGWERTTSTKIGGKCPKSLNANVKYNRILACYSFIFYRYHHQVYFLVFSFILSAFVPFPPNLDNSHITTPKNAN